MHKPVSNNSPYQGSKPKMTASIDIKSSNNTFPPPVRPPSIHCSSYFKRIIKIILQIIKIILQKLGWSCEVLGVSHAQSIKAYNSVDWNPFLLTKQRLTYRPRPKFHGKQLYAIAWYPTQQLLEQQEEQLEMFWTYQQKEMEQVNDSNNQLLPFSRIKKINKADKDARVIYLV
ncbi:hypothetical protein RDI58_010933 [Solanum bulbocastanum]|uniref:Uncharacterized protein n=1 Tax=Solanum bulbocastanum TaxID=147425 RepID=A0AAN8TUN2_SOLBU